MNNYDILIAFSGVDDDLLKRSGERPQWRKTITRWATIAASLALVIAVGFGLWAAFNHVRLTSGLLFNTVTQRGSMSPSVEIDAFYEEMTADELADALPVFRKDLPPLATGTVKYLAESGELAQLQIRALLDGWDEQVTVLVSPNKMGMNLGCIGPVGAKAKNGHLGSLTYTAYRFDWGDRIELWVDFQIGDAYYRISAYDAGKEETAAGRAIYKLLKSYEERLRDGVTLDLGAFHMREEHEYIKRYGLTITEARAEEIFGVYFPTSSPEGLELKNSERYKFNTEDWLSGQWKSPRAGDSNYLDWRIGWFDEKYGTLYSPIFKIEELTLQAIISRACYADDKMTFGVLYGDILVTVNAKGVDPQWVYETLTGLG